MSQISGLYCTENKKTYEQALAMYTQKNEWANTRSIWVMNQTDLYDNMFAYLTPESIILISEFVCGKLPFHVDMINVESIAKMNKYVRELPENLEAPNLSDFEEVEREYDSDEESYEYLDDDELGKEVEEGSAPDIVYIPMSAVSVEAEVLGSAAKITVTQRYTSDRGGPIEGVYVFPKLNNHGEHMGVCQFTASVDGELIVGSILDKDEARAVKSECAKAGEGSYLFEADRETTYSFAVGTIKPQSEVKISITYVQQLVYNDGHFRLSIPQRVLYPIGEDGGCPSYEASVFENSGIDVKVSIKMPANITNVVLPLSKSAKILKSKKSKRTANYHIQDEMDPSQEVNLDIAIEDAHKPFIIAESNQQKGYALLTFVPPELSTGVEEDYCFIVHPEDSLTGFSELLVESLKVLSDEKKFNVYYITEDKLVEKAFDTSVFATTSNIEAAVEKLRTVKHSIPMDEVIETILSESDICKIIYLGTGNIHNMSNTSTLLQANTHRCRFMGVSCGYFNAQNIYFIASAGRGSAMHTYVFNNDLKEKLLSYVKLAKNQIYSNVKINWGMTTSLRTPGEDIFTMYSNERNCVSVSFDKASLHGNVVRFTATAPDGTPVSYDVDIYPRVTRSQLVQTLVAHQWITANDSSPSMEAEVKQVAIDNKLVSKYTSFIAFKRKHEGEGMGIQVKYVPVEVRKKEVIIIRGGGGSGWGIFERVASLAVSKLSSFTNAKKKMSNILTNPTIECSIVTPFGISAKPCPVSDSEFTHVFKGPQADLEGKNCWLNSVLALLFSVNSITNTLMEVQSNDGSFVSDLSLLFKVWMNQDNLSNKDFREAFNFAYGRVWYHMQHLGFTFGENSDAIRPTQAILAELAKDSRFNKIDVVMSEEELVSTTSDEVIFFNERLSALTDKTDRFTVKSFVAWQQLATTDSGMEINHFSTVIPADDCSYYVYDDILKFESHDYQGGLVVNPNQQDLVALTQFVPVTVLTRDGSVVARHSAPAVNMEEIYKLKPSRDALPADEAPHSFKSRPNLGQRQALQLIRWARFGCQYGSVQGYNKIIVSEGAMDHLSDDKVKLLIKSELEMILASAQPVLGFYKLVKLGVFDSIFTLPENVEGDYKSVDLMEGLRRMNMVKPQQSELMMGGFLSVFNNVTYELKQKRKRRELPISHHFLSSDLLCSKKEIHEVSQHLE